MKSEYIKKGPYYIKQCFGIFFSPGELISNLVTIETILEPSLKKKKVSIYLHTDRDEEKKS